jgi:hypothetical protein
MIRRSRPRRASCVIGLTGPLILFSTVDARVSESVPVHFSISALLSARSFPR